MNSLLLLIASWFSPVDMVPWVSANAAYTINTLSPPEASTKCCGLCDNGVMGTRPPAPARLTVNASPESPTHRSASTIARTASAT